MLKISRFDLKLPAELVQTCAALRERELAKFIATNNEGEFQHTIEVKSEKEHFVNFELSNLEITFKDGRFVAQIAQVLKVFQAPEQESQQQQPAPSQQQPSNVGTVTSRGSFEKQSPNVTHSNERLVSPTSGPDAVNLFRNTQYRNSKEISASQNVSQTTSVQPRQMPNTGVNSNTAEEEDDDIIVVKDEDMISRRSKNVAEVTIEPSAAGEPSSSQPSQIYPYSLSQVHLNAPSTITSMTNTEQLVQPSTSQVGSNVPPPPTTPGQMFLHRKMARMQQGKHTHPQLRRPWPGDSPARMRLHGMHFCLVCGKGFQSDILLQRHKKIHSAGKDFVCTICNKAFVYKLSLQRHTDACHNSNPAYTCTICKAVKYSKCNMRRHIEGVHKMKAIQCQGCHGYFTEDGLRDHKCSGDKNDRKSLTGNLMAERADHLTGEGLVTPDVITGPIIVDISQAPVNENVDLPSP
ncbi:zinc finger and BTB domain-containing protein 49 isoform X2 [Lingula anatina]|uniref:Zinc finger and BTB domain-containing protein 49 isoform X2 n=1 Tax=Lingula anatina TaxID=7574 RepID=A0A1S3J6J3_LINAN|nr:zinc finger and BTB domain-containing protein 49 isoform X2 [Lingula anatina]|eukprot:XP_013406010.1 zinc finger and BTB domain-containing protein 49 isoform X2 [Lingula anatina]